MKKNSIIRQLVAAVCIVLVSAAFVTRTAAAPTGVDEKILSHFAKTFTSAEEVTWKHTSDYSKASFVRDNHRMEVFYNAADELISTATYIDMKDLPADVLATLGRKYAGYTCSTAIKYENADGTVNYYTQMESDKKKLVLQSDADGFTTIFHSEKK